MRRPQAEDPELRKKNPFGRAGPVRPPARPFSAEGAASKHLNVTRVPGLDGETYYQLGSNRYISGYLEKAMGMRVRAAAARLSWTGWRIYINMYIAAHTQLLGSRVWA